jgi:hypothetical protein
MKVQDILIESFSNQQVLKYVKQHHRDGFRMDHLIMNYGEWELDTVLVADLHIDSNEPDPEGRILDINYDYAKDITKKDIINNPIVVDLKGWIIDGNHRAYKAKELGMKTIPAYKPIEDPDHETYDQFMARRKNENP